MQSIRMTQVFTVCMLCTGSVLAADAWVVYDGFQGPGSGKHIVLVSGDEEYRSEEALPQLGKILAKHHGFTCTVLFAIDRKTGVINPDFFVYRERLKDEPFPSDFIDHGISKEALYRAYKRAFQSPENQETESGDQR